MGNVSKVKTIFKTMHLNPEPSIWDALHYLVPFVKSKKREKNPWRRATFSKASG